MSNNIVHFNTALQRLMMEYYPDQYNHTFWQVRDLLRMPPFDRTQTIDTGFKYDIICRKIPTKEELAAVTERPNLVALINQRAQEICEIAKGKNKDIVLFWSGGIDSTLNLISLLKNNHSGVKIIVAMNHMSIEENPTFYKNFIQNKMEVVDSENVPDEVIASSVLVTGEYADHCYGTIMTNDIPFEDLYDRNYERHIHAYIVRHHLTSVNKHLPISPEDATKMIDYLRPQIEAAPIAIENSFDYLWWLNYSMRWQCMDFFFRSKFPKSSAEQLDIEYFFDTDAFQHWSLICKEDRYYAKWNEYKLDFKKYIYAFDNDLDYYQNKLKFASMSLMTTQNYTDTFILADGSRLEHGKFSANPKILFAKHGEKLDELFGGPHKNVMV